MAEGIELTEAERERNAQDPEIMAVHFGCDLDDALLVGPAANAHRKGANAEDCAACAGSNPPYPFICPGDDRYREESAVKVTETLTEAERAALLTAMCTARLHVAGDHDSRGACVVADDPPYAAVARIKAEAVQAERERIARGEGR